jgi:putative ABC transport system ATP-binding protein
MPILECRGLSMVFGSGRAAQTALSEVSLAFRPGESCVLLGPSGSGKTTLLSILGCLLTPTLGTVLIDGQAVNPRRLSTIRRQRIGFVFQQAQLLPFLTVQDNLHVAGRNAGLSSQRLKGRMDELLTRLGISELRDKLPDSLSGGERQRVAIARAMLHRPPVLLADEPTAALDWANGQNVVELLTAEAKTEQSVLITVTHDTRLVRYFHRVLQIESGRIVSP